MRILFNVGCLSRLSIPSNGEEIKGVKFQSIYNCFVEIVNGLKEHTNYFYFNVKTTDKEKIGKIEVVQSWHSRIYYVYEYIQSNKYHSSLRGSVPIIGAKAIMLFNQSNGSVPIDIVFDSNVATASEWGKYLSVPSRYVKVIFRAEDGVYKGSDQLSGAVFEPFKIGLFTRLYDNIVPIFLSEYAKTEYIKLARKIIKPSVVMELDRKSKVIKNAIDCTKFEESVKEIPKEDKGVYIGSLMRRKGWEFSLQVYDKLSQTGRLKGAILTTQSSDVVEFKTNVEVHQGLSGIEFMRQAGRAKVFLFNSEYESFGLVIVEAMAMRILPVLPNLEWVFNTVPKDYPYLYKYNDEKDAFSVCARALADWESENIKWLEYSKQFDTNTLNEGYSEIINESAIAVDRLKNEFRFLEKLKDLVETLGDSFTLDDVYKSDFKSYEGRFVLISRSEVVSFIESIGFSVSNRQTDIVFNRK